MIEILKIHLFLAFSTSVWIKQGPAGVQQTLTSSTGLIPYREAITLFFHPTVHKVFNELVVCYVVVTVLTCICILQKEREKKWIWEKGEDGNAIVDHR